MHTHTYIHTKPLQVDVIVTILEANDFNPVFELERYSAIIDEYNAVTGTGGMTRVIGAVFATDNDTTATAAGQLEYYITGGNQRGIFDIVNPAVSMQYVYSCCRQLASYSAANRLHAVATVYLFPVL